MCVAAIAWQAHPDWHLIAIGNRDEFHNRPAAPLARWDDGSGIIAGRDLQGGGTWLGVNEAGRFVLVTNYRVPEGPQPGRPSRGGLVTALLKGEAGPDRAAMNPFNLVLVDTSQASFVANHPEAEAIPLSAGVHGLSNGSFATPWPKTRAVCAALGDWLDHGRTDAAPLFAALHDDRPHPGPSPEPRLSSVFIRDPDYGTRCSTLVLIDRLGRGRIIERSFDPAGDATGERELAFEWSIAPSNR